MNRIVSLGERPEWLERFVEFFAAHWGNEALYRDCMQNALHGESPLPQWFLLMDGDTVAGGCGLIANDFNARQDLGPWLCALFVEEPYRGHALGQVLLDHARKCCAARGFPDLYLITDHIGYYERYGFQFIGTVADPFGGSSRMYHAALTLPPPTLYILGGLPATGKTSVARALARRTKCCHLRIDTLEQQLIDTGCCPKEEINGKGYQIACSLAADQLRNGVSVIADCVNPLALTRQWWRDAARLGGGRALEIELICSDLALHRRRAETRPNDIPGLQPPDWNAILQRPYEPWNEAHLRLDMAKMTPDEAVRRILDYFMDR